MRNTLAISGVIMFSLMPGIALAADSVTAPQSTPALRYVSLQQASTDAVIVDTRVLSQCQQRTLANARCLPATDLLGPNGELPSFADIFWALGTVGLTGKETILVVGNQSTDRDFIAGLLYLCGQAKVEILSTPVEKILHNGNLPVGEGHPRGILRQQIYHASMRDAFMVLPGEVQTAHARDTRVIPIDANQPQAMSASLADIQRDEHDAHAHYVVYADQPRLAIATFTRLLAGAVAHTVSLQVVPTAMHTWIDSAAGPVLQDKISTSVKPVSTDSERHSHIRFIAGVVMVFIPIMILFIASFTKGGKLWI